jgi:hypothetical protein
MTATSCISGSTSKRNIGFRWVSLDLQNPAEPGAYGVFCSLLIHGYPLQAGYATGYDSNTGKQAILTDTQCRTAKPRDKPYKLSDGKGLYLEIKPTG